MTPEELDKLDALLKAATPGPWTPGALETTAICGADTDEAWRSSPFRGVGGPVVLRVDRNDMPSEQNRAAIMALHNAAPALIAAAREAERLRAFVPRWTLKRVDSYSGVWTLRCHGAIIAGTGIAVTDGVTCVMTNADMKTHPDLPTAAAAVCARLGIASVEVGDV